MPLKITKNTVTPKELICFNSDKDFEDYAVCPCATLDLHGQYTDNYLQAVDEGAKFIIGADESAITRRGVITKRVLLPKEFGTPRKDMLVQLSAKNIVKNGASNDASGYTSLTFYQGITTIKWIRYMRYNYLMSISIPNSVICIEKGALPNLDPLEGITFHGSKEEWNAIDKKEDWCLHTNPILVHCTDGDIEI